MAFDINALKLPVIQTGSEGLAVGAWQSFLLDRQFAAGAVDEDFGSLTDTATRNYQRANGLPETGIVDTATYSVAIDQGFIYEIAGLSAKMLLDYLGFNRAEVEDLQRSLNAIAALKPPLVIDGDFGRNSTKGLAEAYRQKRATFRTELEAQLTLATKLNLGTDLSAALDILDGYAYRQFSRLSGSEWVKQFPASRSIADLASPFRERVEAFHRALQDAGIQISIANTLRPPERAYLMHFAVKISRGLIAPEAVPPLLGVDVDWVHYTHAASVQAARQMVAAYGIGTNPAALKSLHTQGLAIDWSLSWTDTVTVKDASGRSIAVSAPRNGENPTLGRIGASYGVYKLAGDPPHWSVNGR